MKLHLELDRQADAAYVRVASRPVSKTKELDSQRIVDYDAQGEVVGLEFLAPSRGVDLSDLPYRQELARLFEGHDIPIFA